MSTTAPIQTAAGHWAAASTGGQAEYVRVPFADQGLNRIPDGVTDEQALFTGDILATGFWAAKISEIKPEDTVLIIGRRPNRPLYAGLRAAETSQAGDCLRKR